MAGSLRCPSCSEPLPAHARFCLSCGARLAALETTLAAAAAPGVPRRYLPKGTRVGESYVVEEVIGEGGMGVVYRARDVALDRLVALKALHPNLLGDRDIRRRFVREADVMRRWRHDHAVGVYDYVDGEDVAAIVMELVEGGRTLDDYLGTWGGPLPYGDVLDIFRGTLSAMTEAHERGIVHRDLKPQNILLLETPAKLHAKVADFGIAKVLEGTKYTMTGALLGTTHYMSPEQVERPKSVDVRSDIYSLGVTLYQSLTGRMPFESESHFALMMAHVNQPPVRPTHYRPGLPAALERLVLDAMAKEPRQRPPSCDAMLELLEEALADVSPRRVPSVEPGRSEPVLVDSDGHEMVLVPTGAFQMGPSRREVHLDHYYLARHPVTNRQFRKFLDVSGYRPSDAEAHRFLSHWRRGECPEALLEHPVVYVSWHDAHAYCAWAGRRLPSEAEWEKGARGLDGRKYPWGRTEPRPEHASFGRPREGTSPVGAHPEGASPFGLLDMAGNVWEWCEDTDDPDFYLSGPSRNPRHTVRSGRDKHVVRGGAFLYDAKSLRTFARSSYLPGYRVDGVGFRCAL